MSTKNTLLKVIFGGIIFLFALALAYAIASYFDRDFYASHYMHSDSYWYTLMIAAGIYVAIGIAVSSVFPVSLGFLFSADVLILHVLGDQYGAIPQYAKLALVGSVLCMLYIFAWNKLRDVPSLGSTAQSQAIS